MTPEYAFMIYGLIGVVVAALSCFVYWAVFGGNYCDDMSGENILGGVMTGVFWPVGVFFLLFFILLLCGKKFCNIMERQNREKS